MRADLDVIFEDDVADLRHLRMNAARRREAEAVGADDRVRMEHATFADAAALAHRDARVEDALLTDFSVLPDVDMRVNDGARSDLRVLIDDGKGKNRGPLFYLGGLRHESLRTDARGNLQRRREKLQKLREGGSWLLHMDGGQRKALHIVGQKDGGRL